MKKLVTYIAFILIINTSAFAQVSINTDGSQPAASSMLDVTSNNKGFLMPRMTFEQRNAIPAPAEGLMVFCTNCGTNGAMSIFSNGAWRTFFPCTVPPPTASTNSVSPGQIIWHWNLPPGMSGSRWNTANNFDAAQDMGLVTSKTETEISCGSTNSRYVWAYNECGNSVPVTLTQTISAAVPATPAQGNHTATKNSITWNWNTVPDATGYKWNTTFNFSTATDMGTSTTKTETGLTCSMAYPRFVWAYNGCGTSEPLSMAQSTEPCMVCGVPITKVHLFSEGVAPVNKSVTYGTVMDIPGEPSKCWITRNLGASNQATAVDDATEESAGWYWQFNRKQGYKHDGTTRTPNTTWISSISENSDWILANDPCALELGADWRIPSSTEWTNVDASGFWTNVNGPFNSALKMHPAGYLLTNDGSLSGRGGSGSYWSNIQNDLIGGRELIFNPSNCNMQNSFKTVGSSLRCLSPIAGLPSVTTSAVSQIAPTTAASGGNITDDGGHAVTERGICWSATPYPTTANSKTINGSGTGSFTGNMTGLTANTLYYVRAYASNSVATVYGDQVSFTTLVPFFLGQSFGGGIIFYIDGTGSHGLIAAPSDQPGAAPWGCAGTMIGGTSSAIGSGQANTTAILPLCTAAGIAARICDDLVLGGYNDWYLPSKDELNQMYLQRNTIGGFTGSGNWSSTELNAGFAFFQVFAGGSQGFDGKNFGYKVRAIRAF